MSILKSHKLGDSLSYYKTKSYYDILNKIVIKSHKQLKSLNLLKTDCFEETQEEFNILDFFNNKHIKISYVEKDIHYYSAFKKLYDLDIILSDIVKLKQNSYFDIIFCPSTLDHKNFNLNRSRIIKLLKLLKKEGVLLIAFNNQYNYFSRIIDFNKENYFYKQLQIETLFKNNNFVFEKGYLHFYIPFIRLLSRLINKKSFLFINILSFLYLFFQRMGLIKFFSLYVYYVVRYEK